MPLETTRRAVRRFIRKGRSWSTVLALTMSGNKVERKANLNKCKNPVLLIYGFGATRRTFAILEKRLYNDGFTVFSIHLGGIFDTFNTSKIEDLGALIQEKVERIYKKYDVQGKLSIIAHSKGGLIGRYYVKRLGGDRRVSRLITLGTPHNGNPWAMLAMLTPVPWVLKSISQMTPMGPFIKRLKVGPFPKKVKLYSIYSKDDIVCPYPCSVLEEAPNVKNLEVDSISHSEFLIKKAVYHLIRHALRDEIPLSLEAHSRKNIKNHVPKLTMIPGAKDLFSPLNTPEQKEAV